MERMASRALQLAGIVTTGAVIGLFITRPWQREEPVRDDAPAVDAVPEAAPSAAPVTTASPTAEGEIPPLKRTFKLPSMAAMTAPANDEVKPKKAAGKTDRAVSPILVPKDWLLRGAGPQHYNVQSDRKEVLSGQASVSIATFNEAPVTQGATLMQSVASEPWVGKRVVFTVSWKGQELSRGRNSGQLIEIWIRALDAANVVIAYNEAQAFRPKAEWQKISVGMDVPWSAAEMAYGITLHGHGSTWIDGAQVDSLDVNASPPVRVLPARLGVKAQEARKGGPLPQPSNLDFEDVTEAQYAPDFRDAPPDAVDRSRF